MSFDENTIVLDTDMGLLTIKGKELHVSRLTLEKGEVDIEGTIDSCVYSSNEALRKSGESLFTRQDSVRSLAYGPEPGDRGMADAGL